MRLGGDEMPVLHSLIHVEGNEIRFDAIAARPPVKVNGEIRRNAVLGDGDRLEIGSFQFAVRIPRGAAVEEPPADSAQKMAVVSQKPDADDELGGDLAERSASELIDLIEREEEEIERFEAARRMGANALLQAVHDRVPLVREFSIAGSHGDAAFSRRTKSAAAARVSTARNAPANASFHAPANKPHDVELLHEVERVVSELNLFSQELERRSDRLAQREASYAESTAVLLDVQQKLTTQLESLLGQVSALKSEKNEQPVRPMRVIA